MDSIAGVECNAAELIIFTPSCFKPCKRFACRDHSEVWLAPQLEAIQKVQYLLGVGNATRPRPYLANNMWKWGMGNVRSVAEWEAFSGVDFKAGTVNAGHKFCTTDVPDEVPGRVCRVVDEGGTDR